MVTTEFSVIVLSNKVSQSPRPFYTLKCAGSQKNEIHTLLRQIVSSLWFERDARRVLATYTRKVTRIPHHTT